MIIVYLNYPQQSSSSGKCFHKRESHPRHPVDQNFTISCSKTMKGTRIRPQYDDIMQPKNYTELSRECNKLVGTFFCTHPIFFSATIAYRPAYVYAMVHHQPYLFMTQMKSYQATMNYNRERTDKGLACALRYTVHWFMDKQIHMVVSRLIKHTKAKSSIMFPDVDLVRTRLYEDGHKHTKSCHVSVYGG